MFAPWLMPETISSGSNSIRPSAAKRTQSTGVPLVANPVVPSPNSTSSTDSGSLKVMLREVLLRTLFRFVRKSSFASDNVEYVKNFPQHTDSAGGRKVGNYFYITTERDLTIYDISQPELPQRMGFLPLPQQPYFAEEGLLPDLPAPEGFRRAFLDGQRMREGARVGNERAPLST